MAKEDTAEVKRKKEQFKIQNLRTDRVQWILFLFAALLPLLNHLIS